MISKVLIVGAGSIGKRHMRIVRDSFPCAEIRIYRHRAGQEVPEFATGCISTAEEVCVFSPEVAIVANPASFHLAIARTLVDLGCHLLIEKPLSDCEDGVAELLRNAKQRGLVLQVGYNLRFLPSLRAFRDQILGGNIGQVLSVRCEVGQYLPSWRPEQDYRESVSARKELGGGVLLELSHEVDYLRWIFGEVAWLQAWVGNCSDLDVDVEDFAAITMGVRSSFQKREIVTTLGMDFFRRDTQRVCIAIGDKGSLSWNAMTGKVEKFSPEEGRWTEVFSSISQRDETYQDQWGHFLRCIRTREKPLVTGEDGLAVLRIVGAVRKSHNEQGRIVSLFEGSQ